MGSGSGVAAKRSFAEFGPCPSSAGGRVNPYLGEGRVILPGLGRFLADPPFLGRQVPYNETFTICHRDVKVDCSDAEAENS